MGELDAAGDAVTGGMLARAAEPHVGEGGHSNVHGRCLNCGTALVGSHCHACGQAGHVHKTMGAIGHDILHGVFHFEGKIWRTLPMLAWRPGELTRRYIDGARARYVSPIALFLFSVFLMFAIVSNLAPAGLVKSDLFDPGLSTGMVQAREKLVEERAQADRALVRQREGLTSERAKEEPRPERIARYENRIAEIEKTRSALVAAEQALPPATTFEAKGAPPPAANNWLDAKFRAALGNPKLLLYKLKTSAYKFSWALIPISLPFIWLLFPFSRRFGMYDHAIFTTYSLTFMSLLVIVLALLGTVGVPGQALAVAASLIPPFHIYRQLKGAYGLRRGSALLRTGVLVTFIMAAIVPAFMILLVYLGVAD
ncbi:DUF3667 domain-containing protein [Sphingomonas sp.]|uniref:DUF3667 domain-containing protein n=1 Tax=Sphingomonas sp. TaxID=28214 RepID=UPI002DD6431C|nr:DUF3667 domain-containing protein [Sphingomonas sp.]